MKNLLIFTLGLSISISAFASTTTTIKALRKKTSKIYNRINDSKEIDAGMFGLDFYSKSSAKNLTIETGKCRHPSQYKLTRGANIIIRMTAHQRQALEDGMIISPELIPTEEEMTDVLSDWSQILDSEELQFCIVRDNPPYTDGREIVFVLVNRKLEFAFGFTQPD